MAEISVFQKTINDNKPNASVFGFKIIENVTNKNRNVKVNIKDLIIPFQYLEEMPIFVKSANWNDISDIMGRFENIPVYSNTSSHEFTLNLTYYVQSSGEQLYYKDTARNQVEFTNWTKKDVKKYISRLRALVYPQLDGNFSPPPKVLLNIGSVFIDYPCIVKAVTVQNLAPFDIRTGEALYHKVVIELKSAYPAWQSINFSQVYKAYDTVTSSSKYGEKIFSRQEYKKQ